LSGLRGHGSGPHWQPGGGGMCLHTVILDPSDANRMFIAISAAGAFRTDDGGGTWQPINRGLQSDPYPTGCRGRPLRAPHRHASLASGVLFMQKHWDVMRSDNAGDSWQEVSGNLPLISASPSTCTRTSRRRLRRPIKSDSEHFPPDGKLRVYRSRSGGNEWEPLSNGLPQENCYVNVLRDAMSVDRLDECGIYFGTTGGQVYASSDAAIPGCRSCAISHRCFRLKFRPRMIRVILPQHLRTLAHVNGEVLLEVEGQVTPRSILDALESRYPMLREPFATTLPWSDGHSCASSPANRMYRTSHPTLHCPIRCSGHRTVSDYRGHRWRFMPLTKAAVGNFLPPTAYDYRDIVKEL